MAGDTLTQLSNSLG